MKKIFILICSIILFTGCFVDNGEFIVVDKQIQDPISVFETSDDKPEGYTRTISRLYILTIRDSNSGENESIVVSKEVFFKYNLGSKFDTKDLSKE